VVVCVVVGVVVFTKLCQAANLEALLFY
jgi:hypothetical protein